MRISHRDEGPLQQASKFFKLAHCAGGQWLPDAHRAGAKGRTAERMLALPCQGLVI